MPSPQPQPELRLDKSLVHRVERNLQVPPMAHAIVIPVANVPGVTIYVVVDRFAAYDPQAIQAMLDVADKLELK